jgi:tetratricopeptide (TPR) repeat protein
MPDAHSLLLRRVRAAENADMSATVVAILEIALRDSDDRGFFRYTYGDNLRLLGNLDEAEHHLLLVTEVPPERRYLVELSLALLYADRGDGAGAETRFKAAISASPLRTDAIICYARFLALRGRIQEALSQLDVAAEISGEEAENLTLRGNYLRALKQFPLAAEAYRSSLRLDSDQAVVRTALEDLEHAIHESAK